MMIVSSMPIISFVVEKYTSNYAPELRDYVLSRKSGLAIVKQTDLQDYYPFSPYNVKGEMVVVLKHIILHKC